MIEPLLTAKEAAARLGCTERKLHELRLRDQLPHLRGKPILILEADLAAYAAALASPPIRKLSVEEARRRAILITLRRRAPNRPKA